jgi:death-on-curing protein
VTDEPAWLSIDAILAIHAQLVAEHGGSPILRDRGLLESALARPRNLFAYGDKDFPILATAYASGLTRNHPFIDGNKRIAFMACYMFLGVNGWSLDAPEEQVVTMMWGLSERSIGDEAFTSWLRSWCIPKKRRVPKSKRPTRKRGGRVRGRKHK